MIRIDLECKTRTNLPINHCAEMLTRTLRSEVGLFAQPPLVEVIKEKINDDKIKKEKDSLCIPPSFQPLTPAMVLITHMPFQTETPYH
ncbi:hypothetical protein F6P71_00655 [Streptococcus suis]|nr:hypothetical protein DP111_01975 [Streptococcus suis]MBO8110628.1 hypothetical protein [Streptococcus suis]MBS8078587.1 hypothetical protein [Streptococcus suis]MBS8089753.1 hypothetical protein [Streptococcus suis]